MTKEGVQILISDWLQYRREIVYDGRTWHSCMHLASLSSTSCSFLPSLPSRRSSSRKGEANVPCQHTFRMSQRGRKRERKREIWSFLLLSTFTLHTTARISTSLGNKRTSERDLELQLRKWSKRRVEDPNSRKNSKKTWKSEVLRWCTLNLVSYFKIASWIAFYFCIFFTVYCNNGKKQPKKWISAKISLNVANCSIQKPIPSFLWNFGRIKYLFLGTLRNFGRKLYLPTIHQVMIEMMKMIISGMARRRVTST